MSVAAFDLLGGAPVCCNGGVTGHCTLVVCGAPLAGRATDMAAALVRAGWQLRVILTPAAEQWVQGAALEAATGAPAQTRLRAPGSPKPPRAEAIAVVPMTFNSAGKLAHGIADTLAHSAMAEALGAGVPFVAVPMVNPSLAGHPAWGQNTRRLSAAGVTWVSVVDGTAGHPEPVLTERGAALVEAFDPEWVSGHLSPGSRG